MSYIFLGTMGVLYFSFRGIISSNLFFEEDLWFLGVATGRGSCVVHHFKAFKGTVYTRSNGPELSDRLGVVVIAGWKVVKYKDMPYI